MQCALGERGEGERVEGKLYLNFQKEGYGKQALSDLQFHVTIFIPSGRLDSRAVVVILMKCPFCAFLPIAEGMWSITVPVLG